MDGLGSGDGGGAIEGAGKAVGSSHFRLVVVTRTGVTWDQSGTGEMACRAWD